MYTEIVCGFLLRSSYGCSSIHFAIGHNAVKYKPSPNVTYPNFPRLSHLTEEVLESDDQLCVHDSILLSILLSRMDMNIEMA